MDIDDRTLLLALIEELRRGLYNARHLTPVMPRIRNIIHLVEIRNRVADQLHERRLRELRVRLQERQEVTP